MMGRSHALSAAAGWLGGCATAATFGADLPAGMAVAGALVSAGYALLPDLDHPESTVSRTLGPLTGLLSSVTVWVARQVQLGSCTHCLTQPDRGGHRGLTHTALGAVFFGLLTVVGAVVWGEAFALTVAGFAVWLAAHTALSSRMRARIGDVLLPGRVRRYTRTGFRIAAGAGALMVAAFAVGAMSHVVAAWWWLGIAVGWGCLAHSLGDALTFSRVPLLWPLRIRGCRWTRVGAPAAFRFRTGSRTETVVVWLMAVAGVVSIAMLGAVAP